MEGTAGNATAENNANKRQPSVDVDDQEMDSDSDDDLERDPQARIPSRGRELLEGGEVEAEIPQEPI